MQFSDFVAEFMYGLCILELFYAFPDALLDFKKASTILVLLKILCSYFPLFPAYHFQEHTIYLTLLR